MISRISTKIIIALSILKHPLYGGVGIIVEPFPEVIIPYNAKNVNVCN